MKCGNLKASSETLTANTILVAGLPVRLSIDSSRHGCTSLPSFEERGERNGRAGVKITPGWLRQHLKIKVNLNELLFDSDWERWTCPTFRMLLWEKNKNSVQFLCPIKQSSSSNRFPTPGLWLSYKIFCPFSTDCTDTIMSVKMKVKYLQHTHDMAP